MSSPCHAPTYSIILSSGEEQELRRRTAKYTLSYFEVIRAKMILLAAEGLPNDQIAARLDARREVVSMWRKRFFEDRMAGLEERSRPGRPRTFSPQSWSYRSKLSPVNCRPLITFPFPTGTPPDITRQVCQSGLVATISDSTIWRWLHEDAIRPRAYLAALDVHHARVFGRCESNTGIAPFHRLVEQVMTRPPCNEARRILIWAQCRNGRFPRLFTNARNRFCLCRLNGAGGGI